MTLQEKEEMEKWLTRKENEIHARLIREDWKTPEGKEGVALSYWFLYKGEDHRIFKVGETLLEAVNKCRDKESQIQK